MDAKLIQRLQGVINHSGCSLNKFASLCQISQPTLDKQMRGLRAVSLDTVSKVLSAFPEISAEWLMRGKGDMMVRDYEKEYQEKVFKMLDMLLELDEARLKDRDTIVPEIERRINNPANK